MPSSADRYIILASTSLAGYTFSRFPSHWFFVLIDDITVRHGCAENWHRLNNEKFHVTPRWFMLPRIEFYRNKIQKR